MIATCPTCAWPAPELVSAHAGVRYLRCICGRWLILEHGTVVAAAGSSSLADRENDRVA
ncbi:hypothetical protein [Nocardia jejuensis]|uniref:hypothetical protein n=1 Tax=Nocardia jejuensis TaxID=328049 RepID=UPI000AD71941|nr:hypothetical protein [Nocardia jejuensis]